MGRDTFALFDELEIAKSDHYREHLHNYDVIYIDFSRLPKDGNCYEQYISRIQDGINRDLAEAYADLKVDMERAVWDNLQAVFEKNRSRFVFVMDEWDAIFHKSFITEADKKYDMATKERFSEYFGFLDSEVDQLFTVYQQTTANAKITRRALAEWYDGYHTAAGSRMYNPRSVVCAWEEFWRLESDMAEIQKNIPVK